MRQRDAERDLSLVMITSLCGKNKIRLQARGKLALNPDFLTLLTIFLFTLNATTISMDQKRTKTYDHRLHSIALHHI